MDALSDTAPCREQRQCGLLPEEYACAFLLALMVLIMFAQAGVRNVPPLGRTVFATWLAHASEVLPSGLTWLTFLGCAAVTRRQTLLRVRILERFLHALTGRGAETVLWSLWGLFFAAILMLGVLATYAQRHQTTSVDWLPAWAVALSLPIGSGLVLWRTVQNVVDLWRGEPGAAASDDPGRAGEEA